VLILQLDWITFDEAGDLTTYGDVPHWPPWERVDEARRFAPDAPPHLGVVGLALAAAVASWFEWAALRRRLRRRLGEPVRSGWGRPILVAGVAAAAIMVPIGRIGLPSPVDAAIIGVAGLGVYAGGLMAQGVRPAIGRKSNPSND
jgi:hypothetical protein